MSDIYCRKGLKAEVSFCWSYIVSSAINRFLYTETTPYMVCRYVKQIWNFVTINKTLGIRARSAHKHILYYLFGSIFRKVVFVNQYSVCHSYLEHHMLLRQAQSYTISNCMFSLFESESGCILYSDSSSYII